MPCEERLIRGGRADSETADDCETKDFCGKSFALFFFHTPSLVTILYRRPHLCPRLRKLNSIVAGVTGDRSGEIRLFNAFKYGETREYANRRIGL